MPERVILSEHAEPQREAIAAATGRQAWQTRLRPWLARLQSVIGLLGIIIVAILISPQAHDGSRIFLEPGNLTDIVRQVSEIGIISLGMTLVILTGGIDLSVGSVLALSASLVAMVVTKPTDHMSTFTLIALAIGLSLAASCVVGIINGVVLSRLRVQPFIVTLATMIGVRGLARWLTNNTNIDFGFGQDASAIFAATLSGKMVVIGCFAVLAIIFAIVLRRTVFGRYVRAVGDNQQAAQYAGIPIARTQVWVYALCGLLAGLAGVLHAAQCYQGNPNDGVAYELEAIAAVVIGGTRLSGGKGTIAGTIVGTLIMGILTNILRLKMVDANVELMIKAVIIVAAVWLQSRRRAA